MDIRKNISSTGKFVTSPQVINIIYFLPASCPVVTNRQVGFTVTTIKCGMTEIQSARIRVIRNLKKVREEKD